MLRYIDIPCGAEDFFSGLITTVNDTPIHPCSLWGSLALNTIVLL